MGEVFIGYLIVCFFFFLIGVLILRWAFRINKIVEELESIKKVLMASTNTGSEVVGTRAMKQAASALKSAQQAVSNLNKIQEM